MAHDGDSQGTATGRSNSPSAGFTQVLRKRYQRQRKESSDGQPTPLGQPQPKPAPAADYAPAAYTLYEQGTPTSQRTSAAVPNIVLAPPGHAQDEALGRAQGPAGGRTKAGGPPAGTSPRRGASQPNLLSTTSHEAPSPQYVPLGRSSVPHVASHQGLPTIPDSDAESETDIGYSSLPAKLTLGAFANDPAAVINYHSQRLPSWSSDPAHIPNSTHTNGHHYGQQGWGEAAVQGGGQGCRTVHGTPEPDEPGTNRFTGPGAVPRSRTSPVLLVPYGRSPALTVNTHPQHNGYREHGDHAQHHITGTPEPGNCPWGAYQGLAQRIHDSQSTAGLATHHSSVGIGGMGYVSGMALAAAPGSASPRRGGGLQSHRSQDVAGASQPQAPVPHAPGVSDSGAMAQSQAAAQQAASAGTAPLMGSPTKALAATIGGASNGSSIALPAAGAAAAPIAGISMRATADSIEPLQSFWAYLQGEAHPAPKIPIADVVWGQTERDRVYNFLLYVPYQLERLIQLGTLLCWDSLIAVVTIMPCRALMALMQLTGLTGLLGWMVGGGAGRQRGKANRLAGYQVYDVLCLLIVISSTVVLCAVKPGFIYYWLKDITSEFLKMSVLSAAFEITDKILSNFGMDVMEALNGTCTLWVSGRRSTAQLATDLVIAWGITITHALTLMCEGLILAVALNSSRQGLLALLIANNFVEIKGAVFKRWDVPRIWGLVCQDIVERMHLWAVLFFVIVEEMDSSASWRPSNTILWESARILGAEIIIDVLKHAVLGKFNDVRPGIYREYTKDLCEKAVESQSHSLNKLMGFQSLPTVCLILRGASSLFWMRVDAPGATTVWRRGMWLLVGWLMLLLVKPLMGYALKIQAHAYVRYYNANFGKLATRNMAARTPAAAAAASAAAAAALGHAGSNASQLSLVGGAGAAATPTSHGSQVAASAGAVAGPASSGAITAPGTLGGSTGACGTPGSAGRHTAAAAALGSASVPPKPLQSRTHRAYSHRQGVSSESSTPVVSTEPVNGAHEGANDGANVAGGRKLTHSTSGSGSRKNRSKGNLTHRHSHKGQ